MWYNYSGASIYTFQFSELTISSKSITKICIMHKNFWGNFAQLRVMFLCCYHRADVRCLSRVTDLILWNIRKTRNSSVFQNVDEGLHFTPSWALSSEDLYDCLWMQCCSTQRCLVFHPSLITPTAILQSQYSFFQTKETYPNFVILLVAGNSVQT